MRPLDSGIQWDRTGHTHLKPVMAESKVGKKWIARRQRRRRQWHPIPVLLPEKSCGWRSLVGCSPWSRSSRTRLSDFTFTFHFHALEKEMATHSSVLAWRIPGTGKPGGLPSLGSHRVGHDWSDLAAVAAGDRESYDTAVPWTARFYLISIVDMIIWLGVSLTNYKMELWNFKWI